MRQRTPDSLAPLYRGETLYVTGRPAHSLYAIRCGSLKTYAVNPDGEEFVQGFFLPGDVLGLESLAGDRHGHVAVALEPTLYCEISAGTLEKLLPRLTPLFLGPSGENGAIMEALLTGFLRAARLFPPALAVTGVLGTTEFGTIDALHRIVVLQKRFAERGMGFAFHLDAAWGGYLGTLFRRPDGGFLSRQELRRQFRYFPTAPVYQSFGAVVNADTVTVDPHKLGYVA